MSMFLTGIANKKKLTLMALAAAMILLPAGSAYAGTLDYTFTGVGSGTVTGNTNTSFSDQAFTISFVEDTSTLYNSSNSSLGAGYYAYAFIDGTFTEGSYSTTFTSDILEVNGNASTGMGAYETVDLFNSDFGSSLVIGEDPAVLGYALATTFDTGVVTSNIAAYQDTEGFTTTTGDVVEFDSLNSLEFAATSPTPEPSSILLMLTGLCGGALLLRRRVTA
jgi:hypothetical protein